MKRSSSWCAFIGALLLGLCGLSVAASAQGVAPGATKIFLSNGIDVAAFAINNQSPGAPYATISSKEAEGLAVASGRLFVARENRSDLAVYDVTSLRQVGRLLDPGQKPMTVAVSQNGSVYVGNVSTTRGGPGSVSVYEAGSIRPTKLLTCSRLVMVNGVAVNARGDVFVNQNRSSSGSPEVDVFRAGSNKCHALSIQEYYYAGGAMIDPQTQDLVIADEGSRQILIAPPPYGTVTQVITLPRCIGEEVWDLALDPVTSLLYTSDPVNGADVFNYPNGGRIATYSMGSAVGIALSR
ncbi:MAG: hypothetical protein JO043_12755 [Candidatus Eremiobacteraeota bacterium]|nr:hypothetical protein [Candidatus Eremiobacteraeota bacterium]